MEYKYKLILISIIVGFLLGSFILFINTNQTSEINITNPTGEEVDYLIKIVNCTEVKDVNDTDFLIPYEYIQAKRVFSEKKNETHGKYCWYDSYKKEEINKTWVLNNCISQEEGLLCDKGFIVSHFS
jgi:hypothetical protein